MHQNTPIPTTHMRIPLQDATTAPALNEDAAPVKIGREEADGV